MNQRLTNDAIALLAGASIGSFSMLLFAGARAADASSAPSAPAPAVAPMQGGSDQDRIVRAVKLDEPSVVALDVDINGQRYVPPDPFAQMFPGAADSGHMSPYHERASGSGFVYSRDGLIATNAHVVQFAKGTNVRITVVFSNGDRVPAHVYAANPAADVALVKVDHYAKLPPPLALSPSNDVAVGEWAIAIGEPFALQHSVSVGVVSGFDRTETIGGEGGSSFPRTFTGLLQTSAPINPGNSGGPLIGENGLVIGINQSVASPQGGAQGIGFAIPADTIGRQMALLESHPGQMNGPPMPYLGISMADVKDGIAIEGVYQGGPADKAGIQPGDVIEKIDGRMVTKDAQVEAAVRAAKPGDVIRMEIMSGGFKKLAAVTVGTAPSDFQVGEVRQPNEVGP